MWVENGSVSGREENRINPLTYGKTQSDGGRHIWEKRLHLELGREQAERPTAERRLAERQRELAERPAQKRRLEAAEMDEHLDARAD